jgi:hypothetical protein
MQVLTHYYKKILTEMGVLDFRRRANKTPPFKGRSKPSINRGGFGAHRG